MIAAEWIKDLHAALHPPTGCVGSQSEEDQVLRLLLPDDPVVYVDIGAGDPVTCSNTWQFYQAGGYGLLIEPCPELWGPLLRHRPRDRLWPTGASIVSGTARFELSKSRSTLGNRGHVAPQEEWTQVELVKTRTILDHFPEIRDNCRLLDIDVEGHELMVLDGIDWNAFRPEVIIIEDYSGGFWPMMKDLGYMSVARTVHNVIYVRKERATEDMDILHSHDLLGALPSYWEQSDQPEAEARRRTKG